MNLRSRLQPLLIFLLCGGCTPWVIDMNGDGNGQRRRGGGGDGFHVAGYAQAAVHGPDANLQTLDCRGCHGTDLTGGSAVSCDSCHKSDWRGDCVFCHGAADTAGAPPRDIDGENVDITFRAHTSHALPVWTAPLECSECHPTPTDAMSNGHAFDDTPGVAEVLFAGLSSGSSYSAGTCSNNYCHGNGQGANGAVSDGDPLACDSCHAGINSGNPAWESMSGEHRRHLGKNVVCRECHASVAGPDSVSILEPALHVDGLISILITEPNFTVSGNGQCTGVCHGTDHDNDAW